MDLLNEKREQPEEKSKGKKIVLILLILSIIGAIGIGILISFTPNFMPNVSDEMMNIIDKLMVVVVFPTPPFWLATAITL